MVKTRSIQIRLTKQQHEQLKNDSIATGFGSISDYIRFLAFHRNPTIENKIYEMHDLILNSTAPKKKKRFKKNETL